MKYRGIKISNVNQITEDIPNHAELRSSARIYFSDNTSCYLLYEIATEIFLTDCATNPNDFLYDERILNNLRYD